MTKTISRSRTVAVLGVLLACTLAVGAGASGGRAPQTPAASSVEPIAQLLAEVHALRIAMEQQASVGPRIQLALARLSIEEQRVTHLSSQLDSVREQLSGMSRAMSGGGMKDRLTEIEKNLTIEADPAKRAALESEQRGMKQAMAMQAAMEQRLRDRESEIAQALASEQARWSEMSSRLDDLERSLAPVR